ncbi:hypothetical protein XFUD_09200 [Xylella fastidiosa]|nr:hypothetical protein XFUD_09200 [Xylella fastidiosa]ALR08890.2 hypothetical protein XFFB_06365 [Xylella fastidiosa]OCA57498.1 hypothetical protein AA93_09020 [Xylella fastidiosa subsp. pauca 11399]
MYLLISLMYKPITLRKVAKISGCSFGIGGTGRRGSRLQTASEGVVGSIPSGATLVHDARGNDTAISKYTNNADMSGVFIGGNPVVSDRCGG